MFSVQWLATRLIANGASIGVALVIGYHALGHWAGEREEISRAGFRFPPSHFPINLPYKVYLLKHFSGELKCKVRNVFLDSNDRRLEPSCVKQCAVK